MSAPASRSRMAVLWVIAARFLLFCATCDLAYFATSLCAQTPLPEYASKAGWVAKITQFVKWPAPGDSAILVGILGEDTIGGALEAVVTVKRSKSIEDLKNCQVIFISKSEREKLPAILAALEGTNILTVGESEGFAKQGGAIGLLMDGDKVRMEINPGAAKRAGLGIDLRLLKLASRVVSS